MRQVRKIKLEERYGQVMRIKVEERKSIRMDTYSKTPHKLGGKLGD